MADSPEKTDRGTKGLIMAGGSGSRLYPLSCAVNKHLLAVYDKPMIYYPLATLMSAGIRDVLLITRPPDVPAFQQLLGDGHRFGISIRYAVQPEPAGLAQAFDIGRAFIGRDRVTLILGDNIFDGRHFQRLLAAAVERPEGATVFAFQVPDPRRFGVVQLDGQGQPVSLEEKPEKPRSNWAVAGLYCYDNQVVDLASQVEPSRRGELEITDVNREYLRRGQLHCCTIRRGCTWFDAGTGQAMLQAGRRIAAIEAREGRKVACLEEIALLQGFLDAGQVERIARSLDNDYGRYLLARVEQWGR